MLHYLKTWPDEFSAIAHGIKTFEIRKDDRKFSLRDILCLQLYDTNEGYLNEHIFVRVKYILDGGKFGINDEYVAMAIELIETIKKLELDDFAPHGSKER